MATVAAGSGGSASSAGDVVHQLHHAAATVPPVAAAPSPLPPVGLGASAGDVSRADILAAGWADAVPLVVEVVPLRSSSGGSGSSSGDAGGGGSSGSAAASRWVELVAVPRCGYLMDAGAKALVGGDAGLRGYYVAHAGSAAGVVLDPALPLGPNLDALAGAEARAGHSAPPLRRVVLVGVPPMTPYAFYASPPPGSATTAAAGAGSGGGGSGGGDMASSAGSSGSAGSVPPPQPGSATPDVVLHAVKQSLALRFGDASRLLACSAEEQDAFVAGVRSGTARAIAPVRARLEKPAGLTRGPSAGPDGDDAPAAVRLLCVAEDGHGGTEVAAPLYQTWPPPLPPCRLRHHAARRQRQALYCMAAPCRRRCTPPRAWAPCSATPRTQTASYMPPRLLPPDFLPVPVCTLCVAHT